MELGPLIKYYRTQKRMTQKQLSKGICSIPHLSKIENNSKEANEETIALLLERLDISFNEVVEKEEFISQLVKEFMEKIIFYLKYSVDETYEKLKEVEHLIPFSNHIYMYELLKYRYFLFKESFAEAESQKDLLVKQKKNFSQHEEYLFQYNNAVFLIIRGQIKEADEILETLHKNYTHEGANGDFFYHRALVKSSLEQSGHAVHFGKMALQSFMNQHNFIRILHTLMLLGINFTHAKIYQEAEACFHHLIRNAELVKEEKLLPQIYHNMGYLQLKKNNKNGALDYYEKSLALQTNNSPDYLVTLYSIGEIQLELQAFEKAKECFQAANCLAKEQGNKKYKLLTDFYLFNMISPRKAFRYLESKVIPYLEETNQHNDDLIRFYKLLSSYYNQQGLLRKSVDYLNKMT